MSVAGACIAVMLIALAQYGINGLGGDFVQDDSAAIVGNGDLRANETTVYDVFVHDYWAQILRAKSLTNRTGRSRC